jgi:hypothetical protein
LATDDIDGKQQLQPLCGKEAVQEELHSNDKVKKL